MMGEPKSPRKGESQFDQITIMEWKGKAKKEEKEKAKLVREWHSGFGRSTTQSVDSKT
jgi:hypothetical protein